MFLIWTQTTMVCRDDQIPFLIIKRYGRYEISFSDVFSPVLWSVTQYSGFQLYVNEKGQWWHDHSCPYIRWRNYGHYNYPQKMNRIRIGLVWSLSFGPLDVTGFDFYNKQSFANSNGERRTSRLALCLSYASGLIIYFVLRLCPWSPREYHGVFVGSVVVFDGSLLGSIVVCQLPCRRDGFGYSRILNRG